MGGEQRGEGRRRSKEVLGGCSPEALGGGTEEALGGSSEEALGGGSEEACCVAGEETGAALPLCLGLQCSVRHPAGQTAVQVSPHARDQGVLHTGTLGHPASGF